MERRHGLLKGAIVALFLVAALANALLGGIGEDESFYASAADRVWDGAVPYADFMFPQSPLPAYYYSPVGAVGILGARFLGLAAGLGALLLTMGAAERVAGKRAALVAGLVLATCMPFAVWSGNVSPLPLAALLVAASVWLLVAPLPPTAAFALSGAMLGLAAGVRLNAAVAVPLLLAYAWLARRRLAPVLAAAAGAGAVLLVVYAPFLLLDAASTRWSVLTYQLLDARDPATGLFSLLKYKADGAHYFVAEYPFVVAGAVFGALLLAWRHRRRPLGLVERDLLPAYLGVLALAMVGVTFAKVYVQAHYLLPVLPVLAVLLGTLVARLLAGLATPRARATLLGWVAVALVVGFVGAAPPLVRHLPADSDPDTLAQAAAFVAARTGPDEHVMGFLPAVAILADRAPTPGMEMGKFSYYPALPAEEAARAHVLDLDRVKALLAAKEPGALVLREGEFRFTPFPTAALAPAEQEAALAEIDRLVAENYEKAASFGPAGEIAVWMRR